MESEPFLAPRLVGDRFEGGVIPLHVLSDLGVLQEIESVERIYVLDPLDIAARLGDLKQVRNGWIDGEGVAPSAAGLDWLASSFGKFYPEDLPLPHLYPTPSGGVMAEWTVKPFQSSLEIDLGSHRGEWHALNMQDDSEEAYDLDLTESNQWGRLVISMRNLSGPTS